MLVVVILYNLGDNKKKSLCMFSTDVVFLFTYFQSTVVESVDGEPGNRGATVYPLRRQNSSSI